LKTRYFYGDNMVAAGFTIQAVVIGALGGAVGPLIADRIADITGSYQLVFLVLAALSVIGLVLLTRLDPIRVLE
jgi:MFS family permease